MGLGLGKRTVETQCIQPTTLHKIAQVSAWLHMSGSRAENVEEKEKATTLEVWVHVNGYRSNRSVHKTMHESQKEEQLMYRGNVIDGYISGSLHGCFASLARQLVINPKAPHNHLLPLLCSLFCAMSIHSLRSRQSNCDLPLDYNGLNDSEALEISSAIAHSRQPDMEWVFNKGLKLVLHDVNCCHMCEDFTVHNSNATIRSHTYHTACSACKLAITRDVQGRIDRRQSQLEATKKKALHLRQQLIGLHKSLNTSHNELRMSLG